MKTWKKEEGGGGNKTAGYVCMLVLVVVDFVVNACWTFQNAQSRAG